MEELGKSLMIAGWFFGAITFLFGLFLLFGSPIAGLIVMFIGVLMCYGGSRSGRGGISNTDMPPRSFPGTSYTNNPNSYYNPNNPYGFYSPSNPNNPNGYYNPSNPNNPTNFKKRY